MAGKTVSLKELRTLSQARVPPRHGLRILAIFIVLELLLLFVLSLVSSSGALAAPVKGEVKVVVQDGFARLMFRFAEEVEAEVHSSNNIVIIAFKTPVDIATDRISVSALGYVSAARRDPDGHAVRLALARKVRINFIPAGERLFVDLLPETWTGLAPGPPQEAIDELTARAREAERRARQQLQQQAQRRQAAPIRVRVAQQPTFTRYVFELPDAVHASTARGKDSLTVVFDAPLKFDLADAKAASPPTLASVDAEPGEDTTSIRFVFVGKVDVRTFREDNAFSVDLGALDNNTQRTEVPLPLALRELAAVQVVPPDRNDAPAAAAPSPETKMPPEPAARPVVRVPLPPPRPPSAPPRPTREAAPAEDASEPAKPTADASPASRQASDKAQHSPPETVAPHRPSEGSVAPEPKRNAANEEPPTDPAAARNAAAPAVKASAPGTSEGEEPRLKSLDPTAPVAVELKRQGDNLRLTFPFTTRTSAAVFRRFDTVWIVFDASVPIDVSAVLASSVSTIRAAEVTKVASGQFVRIRLDRPKLASMATDGNAWSITIGDMVLEPTRALGTIRNISGGVRASVSIPFEEPQRMHRIADPDVGDTLFVITGFGPARGFLKIQEFVEFRTLTSTHGVVIQPLADELTAELASDRIVVGRPGGLTLSAIESAAVAGQSSRLGAYRPVLLDTQLWGFDRQAQFQERKDALMRAAADAPLPKRTSARLELARFYLAKEMYPEAKGILDVSIAEDRATAEDPSAVVLRAIASTMMGRAADGMKDLSSPIVGNQQDAPLWRGLAYMRQGKWPEAREAFKVSGAAITTLPLEFQRIAMTDALRAAIEVGDFAEAARTLSEFDALGVPRELEATLSVLKGRLTEGLGRISDALKHYRSAADSWDRPAATQGRLRDIVLSHQLGEINRSAAIAALEELTTVWRGDETEIEALQLLARLHTEEGRYRDAFHVMRTALAAHPGSDMTRRIQEEAAATFDALFLAGRGDAMPAIEALSLFYDYSELTPIGHRGDEMIRRLADRLVAIDLLDQASELLQHQIDHRLQGAARAQVAARLAVVYLMNSKPDRALQALRATRSSELTQELRAQRLLLEARALSDTGRHDLALEVVASMNGREVDRLRADILWSARRWSASAEQVEKIYGERWREFAPLNETERADMLRAAIGYALADDMLGLDRFRQKYIAKMAETADSRAFEILTSPMRTGTAEFSEVAKAAGSVNTLDGFLREMRTRYLDFGAAMPAARQPQSRAAQTLSTGG